MDKKTSKNKKAVPASKKKGMSVGKMVAIGAGVAAVSAGAYALLGPNGKKNQKKAAVWMHKMENDMKKKMTSLKNASEPMYHKAVDALAVSYGKEYKAHEKDIKTFAKQLKGNWKKVSNKVVRKAVSLQKKRA